MRTQLIALLLCLCSAKVAAQTPLDADQFDAIATGQTIYYNDSFGVYAGVEAYHPRRRVTWVSDGGFCQKGNWYQQDTEICFRYEGYATPACWTFYYTDGQLLAEPTPGAVPWVATRITTDPIPCTDPLLSLLDPAE